MGRAIRRAGLALAVLALTFFVAVWLVADDLNAPRRAQAPFRLFTVEPGWDTDQIGQALLRQGFIRSAWYFHWLVRVAGVGGRLEAGVYLLSPAESTQTILATLTGSDTALRRVVVPEGFTVHGIADRLARMHIVSAAAFLAAARTFANPYLPPRAPVRYRVEGFLFPGVYLLPRGVSAEDVIRLMFATFQRQVTPSLRRLARREGLSVDAWVTLASIVERETKLARERPIVAAVFWNRLRLHMPLQSDATVLYALRGRRLTPRDLWVASPYNTYRHVGLPPGPIANPGRAALLAVLQPAHVGYLYFVGRPDGSHIFSNTYAQQLAAEAAISRTSDQVGKGRQR